jgi:hypothetical protein
MSDLKELLARVEKAEGPDREIDAALQRLIGGEHIHWGCGLLVNGFTASLDASLALVERVLPGWLRELQEYGEPDSFWWVTLRSYPFGIAFGGRAATPALATCCALLKALIAKENDRG